MACVVLGQPIKCGGEHRVPPKRDARATGRAWYAQRHRGVQRWCGGNTWGVAGRQRGLSVAGVVIGGSGA
jgi:hypothetical protein